MPCCGALALKWSLTICLRDSPCAHGTCRFSQGELEKLDSEGRVILTDHGAFVLINVYGPAISTEDSAEERYAFKLQFYKVRRQARYSVSAPTMTLAHVTYHVKARCAALHERQLRQAVLLLLSSEMPAIVTQGFITAHHSSVPDQVIY